ncbi:ATP-binding protein [Azospirillum halopraeferens]|uniref:sensor histidine kinase n=1 Tax=Azospirillum halopraeferens TaxID=34010 RepID=UPI000419F976|nr:ATP-binding protein [Azospirillum halopraeferens]
MRITYRIATVGGIPVATAAFIAVFAGWLLHRAEQSREAAALAATAYRDMIVANAARNDYIHAPPGDRGAPLDGFRVASQRVGDSLDRLAPLAGEHQEAEAIAAARRALDRHTDRMNELVRIVAESDALITDMAAQEAVLLTLTDQARRRQHASGAALLDSLAAADSRLRASRAIVDRLHDLREALLRARFALVPPAADASDEQRRFARRDAEVAVGRVIRTLEALRPALAQGGETDDDAGADGGHTLYAEARGELAELQAVLERDGRPEPLMARFDAVVARMLKVADTGYTAVQDEVAGLLAYSVTANAVERETQNVAVRTLDFSARTGRALARRDTGALLAVQADSATLHRNVAELPISPLIQDEMLTAIGAWRAGLKRTTLGLSHRNEAIAVMDADAGAVTDAARRLNDLFQERAVRSAGLLRPVLAAGATGGLLLAAAAALLVARGITRPLQRLQRTTLRLARDPHDGPVTDGVERRDELGDMARAMARFADEIARREDELRRARDRADATLAELRRTQAHLVQAEKLAALGRMVAGVAHEINTPLGVTLSASTLIQDRLPRIVAALEAGELRRSELATFLDDLSDAADLLTSSTVRTAEMVQRFKQTGIVPTQAAPVRFDLRQHLEGVLAGLEPVRAAAGVTVRLDCPEGMTIDGHPDALTLITTHLLENAVTHAFAPGSPGTVAITARGTGDGGVELVFADDGRGIPEADRDRVFDPFFTTRRDRGFLGLGLHAVHNTVTLAGGSIELADGAGTGARFVVRLPPATPSPAAPAEPVTEGVTS